MFNPPHPGTILKSDIIEPLGLTLTETAEHLGVSRKHLSSICNGGASISAELAIMLEQAFKNPSADVWMKMQAQYDVWHARQESKRVIGPLLKSA